MNTTHPAKESSSIMSRRAATTSSTITRPKIEKCKAVHAFGHVHVYGRHVLLLLQKLITSHWKTLPREKK